MATTVNKDRSETSASLRTRFAALLHAFAAFPASRETALRLGEVRMSELLGRFAELRRLAQASAEIMATKDQECFRRLLAGYENTVTLYRKMQEKVADDFNLLEVMRLTGKEIRHSMVLAWLLDHDLRRLGTHAQGNLGFRLFLNELHDLGLPVHFADCTYSVRREVAGEESIVDLEVTCRGKFLIHIENKIWASEGTDQTDREWADLQRRARELNIPRSAVHALFLTPSGAKPTNPNFVAISWGRIARILERFADDAKPQDVRLFASHYARALRRFIVLQNTGEDDNAQRTLQRG